MFRFKQFTVHHDLCAMKVGTDGVLLGAWADCSDATTILDVGTGSGLIALMLAQRSNATIQAIDIDEGAYEQALFNASQSPFHSRIKVVRSSYQDYTFSGKFDLIVSNPPYFIHSLKSSDKQRSDARHNDSLPFEELIQKSVSLLSSKGKLSLILPFENLVLINEIADRWGLSLCNKTIVKPTPELPPKRLLLTYSLEPVICKETILDIEISRHVYSEEYISLTKDFYLKM